VENPDLVRSDCGGIWRILTQDQIRKKFAHLGAIAKKKRREGCRGGAAPSSGETVRRQGVAHDRTVTEVATYDADRALPGPACWSNC
jgi:hypothetical protein